MEIKGKRMLVFGLQRSGTGAANLLKGMGADVSVTDIKSEKDLKDFIALLKPSIRLFLGGHPHRILDDVDLIVVSPGVPLQIEPLKKARLKGIEVIGELELAYRILRGSIPFYAITGTNGKSTTTTLLNLIFLKSGKKTLFGGNIGDALSGEISKAGHVECAVVEVSSFQLESIVDFRAKGAALLNITPDHLDRYSSMEEYRGAKEHIFVNQREDDFLLLNKDDPESRKVLNSSIKADLYYFSRMEHVRGCYLKKGMVYWLNKPIISADEIYIKGVHNLENAMAASAMALLAGCPPDKVRDSLMEFKGLPHRLELVRELNGVKYINDSKGTNIGAVLKSLEGFQEPVILIAGGRDKAGDFTALRHLIKEKVRSAVLIGEAREKIKSAIGDLVECHFSNDMEESVTLASSIAKEGDVVLLSPACASFDMFRDFEDRGMKFKEAVATL